MHYKVTLTPDALRDLHEIYQYVLGRDGEKRAEQIAVALEGIAETLEDFPERGNVPKEFGAIGRADCREIHYKPYRIIYQVAGAEVIVRCILDGRRDMQTLLQHRLTR